MKEISIGKILRNIRKINTKYTQRDIGKKISIADNTISSYERENSQPDLETIIKIAKICDFEIKFYNKSKLFCLCSYALFSFLTNVLKDSDTSK